jgi:predicted nucleic acid-binding Zn ribbon protein
MPKNNSIMHPCANPECKNLTDNPRFCSQSCSATVANRANPKRKPEHNCKKCGTSIVSGKTYCSTCLESMKAEQQRAQTNTRSYVARDGERVKRSFPFAFTHRSIVFESGFNTGRLTPADPSGLLLDQLLSLCFSRPEYLRAEDAARYISLMHEFRHFKARIYGREGVDLVSVEQLPIKSLEGALTQWIRAYLHTDGSSLMPHYALDTARFIQALTKGRYFLEPEAWRITPAFGEEISKLSFDMFEAKSFKKEFSDRISLTVAAIVPEKITVSSSRRVFLAPGEDFKLRVRRCHLSESISENSWLRTSPDLSLPHFNLDSEFQLKGYILSPDDSDACFFELPAHWITHEVRFKGSTDEQDLIPVPKWIAEVDREQSPDDPIPRLVPGGSTIQ